MFTIVKVNTLKYSRNEKNIQLYKFIITRSLQDNFFTFGFQTLT